MERLLITGSLGNVGSKLVGPLSQNYQLFELDKSFEAQESSQRRFNCDIADLSRLMITIAHPIRPDGDYGTGKAFGEAVARQYYELYGIESICLRIGTVVPNDSPTYDDRVRKTWLSQRDLEQLVLRSLASTIRFGIYYGVSNNKGRFWDFTNATEELGYEPVDDASLYL